MTDTFHPKKSPCQVAEGLEAGFGKVFFYASISAVSVVSSGLGL
jgi:hypothetical protein